MQQLDLNNEQVLLKKCIENKSEHIISLSELLGTRPSLQKKLWNLEIGALNIATDKIGDAKSEIS